MPTATYTLIATTTLLGNTNEVVFGSLPQNYLDLILILNGENAGGGMNFRFNLDSGSNYTNIMMRTNDSNSVSTGSESGTSVYGNWGSITNNTRSTHVLQVMDYSSTNKHKSTLLRNGYYNNSVLVTEAFAARWANTAAINSIQITTGPSGFIGGYTFSLYGIAG